MERVGRRKIMGSGQEKEGERIVEIEGERKMKRGRNGGEKSEIRRRKMMKYFNHFSSYKKLELFTFFYNDTNIITEHLSAACKISMLS